MLLSKRTIGRKVKEAWEDDELPIAFRFDTFGATLCVEVTDLESESGIHAYGYLSANPLEHSESVHHTRENHPDNRSATKLGRWVMRIADNAAYQNLVDTDEKADGTVGGYAIDSPM